jgi:hypothetical protein
LGQEKIVSRRHHGQAIVSPMHASSTFSRCVGTSLGESTMNDIGTRRKEWMNPDEMEQHMMDGSRAAKLAFTAARSMAKEQNQIEVLGGVWRYRSGNLHHPQSGFAGSVRSTQEAWFELSGSVTWPIPPATCNITIPFDLLRSVWVGSDGKAMMLLSVRLLFDEKKRELTLEPL